MKRKHRYLHILFSKLKDSVVRKCNSCFVNALPIFSRNKMEVELARTKLDLMSLDSQLMAAVQQKVKLSQRLEQWQVSSDIYYCSSFYRGGHKKSRS